MSRDRRPARRLCGLLAFGLAQASLLVFSDHMSELYSGFMMLTTCSATATHAVAAVRSTGHARTVWLLTTAGLALWAIAEVSGGVQTALTGVDRGTAERTWFLPWVRGGYVAAAALMAIAPFATSPRGLDHTWQSSAFIDTIEPYLPLGVFGLASIGLTLAGGSLDRRALWVGTFMVYAALARQFVALRLNAALNRDLARQRTRLSIEATHDALTGLPNRALLNATLSKLDLAPAGQRDAALLMIDLDGFKAVNDTLGHAAGDQLLTIAAKRLRTAIAPLGEAGFAARLGGDEFAVLLDPGGIEAARALADQILDRFSAPMALGGSPGGAGSTVRASIGIAIRAEGLSTERLLRHADLALYEAKQRDKGRYRVFDRGMAVAVAAKHGLQSDLGKALAAGQFTIVYQPVVDLATETSTGAEALVRWCHPQRGLLRPDAFLAAATDAGLLPELDRWVLRTAAAEVAGWRGDDPEYAVAVNVSSAYLAAGTIVDDVRGALRANRLPGTALAIELTEDALMERRAEATITLRELRAMGVRVALDDFGVGYSSLTCLRDLPVDTVKIDRSFVRDLDRDAKAAVLVESLLDLLRGLGLRCVAEGVETASQAAQLRRFRCELAQGHLFARPRATNPLVPTPPRVVGGGSLPPQ